MRRVLVTGGRDFTGRAARDLVWEKLSRLADVWEDFVVVHGDCPTGADEHANDWAELEGHPCERHPADWRHGRKAGPMRNAEMVRRGADVCLVFPGGRGTANCARRAEEAGIPVRRFEVVT